MNERELTNRLEEAIPEVSNEFHNAMLSAFAQIQEEETMEQQTQQDNKIISLPKPKLKKRTAAIILIAALLMATAVGVAATVTPRILTFFWGENVVMQSDFPNNVQYNLAEEMIGDCRVRIEEAVYDGVSLYITYSIRNMNVDYMIAENDRGRCLSEEEYAFVNSWDAASWSDCLWINGHRESIPGLSTGLLYGGDEPGEVVETIEYRLDQEGIFLSGTVRIALPIGENQHIYEKQDTWPRAEDGTLMEPEEGCVVFNLNANVETERLIDGPHTTWEDGTEVWIKEAIFTPVKMYLSIGFAISDETVESYMLANDLDPTDRTSWEWHNSVLDVTDWVYAMMLVDKQGNACHAETSYGDGLWSHGEDQASFVFPYMEEYPSPLYIAPVKDGVADMSRKILIKE